MVKPPTKEQWQHGEEYGINGIINISERSLHFKRYREITRPAREDNKELDDYE